MDFFCLKKTYVKNVVIKGIFSALQAPRHSGPALSTALDRLSSNNLKFDLKQAAWRWELMMNNVQSTITLHDQKDKFLKVRYIFELYKYLD